MRKIKLFLASMLALMAWSVPALAEQYQIVYSAETGTYTETNPNGTYARTWVSTATPTVTLKVSVNNINVPDGGLYGGQPYTLSVEGGYLIKSYVFTARPSDGSEGMSVTTGDGTEFAIDPAGSRVRCTNINAETTTFSVVGRYVQVEGFTIVVEDNPDYVPPVYVTTLGDFSNQKAYQVTNARRTWMFTDAAMGSSQNPDKENAYQQVAFINHDNNFYIYSVGAKKYLNPDNTLTDAEPTPVQIVETGDANYPWFFKFDDQHNININGSGLVLIDTWTAMDDGNKNKVMEAGDFDPTEALAVFNDMTELPDGDYYVRNVATSKYMGYGNSWGTRASLMDFADYVTLNKQEDGTYLLDSRVTNGGDSHFLGKNYFMDNNDPLPLTIAKAGDYWTFAADNEGVQKFIGYNGTSTELAFDLEDGTAPAALWEVLTYDELIAPMAEATVDNPFDATVLVKDANFSRNHRDKSAWVVEASNSNLNGGANGTVGNGCAESWQSAFTVTQTVTVPNGIYGVTAQAALTDYTNAYDGVEYPVVFANDETTPFNNMEEADRGTNMTQLAQSFTAGKYAVQPLFVKVEDGTLKIGVRGTRTNTWCIWDAFKLTYYGAEGEVEDVKFASLLNTIDELRAELETLKGNEYADEAADAVADAALEATADVEKTEESLKAAIATLQTAIDEMKAKIFDNEIVATGEVPNNTMLHWVREPAFGDFHVNTWSTEGNSDGTGMVTPFIENWTYSGNGSLADGDIYYQVPGTLPAGTYEVTALVRANSEAGNDPAGISFFVNDATTDLVAEGTAFTYNAIHGVYANVALKGTVGEDGVLKFGVRLAGTNVNWIAIKDAKFMPYYETSNLDFEEGAPVAGDDAGICTYAKDVAANNTTLSGMQEVPSWTFGNENGDARAAGLFAYGSDKFLGGSGFNVPAAGPVAAEPEAGARRLVVKAGEANQALGVVSVWTAKTSYEQNVTLPAGNYVLTIPYYNAGGTGNIAKNLIGFIANDGTEYLSTAANFGKVGEWVNEVVTFTLTEQTNGKLSMGYTATNSGSGAMPHLFFDNVTIETVSDADLARTDLEAAIVAAELQLESTEGVGEGLFAIPQSAADEYLEAITAALEVLENPDATVEEIRAAIETLKAAGETFAATPKTQPEAGKYYTFRLAKDETFFDPDNEYYMTFEIENDAVGVDLEPVELTFEPAEVEGQYYLASADGMYVGRKSNDWATSVLAENKVAWAFTRMADGAITIDRIDAATKHLGAETDYPNKNTQCWADKNTSTGRIYWFVEPVKEEAPVYTIEVERPTGMGYTTTTFDPVFTEALAYLEIEKETDAVLVGINADGSEEAAPGPGGIDGWCDSDGNFVGWGQDATKICVKFFPSVPQYEICDMNGADVVGATYTVKYGLKANDKMAVFAINVTFVEPEVKNFDIVKTITVNHDEEEKTAYSETTETFDPAEVAEALGLTSIADADQYIVNVTTGDFVLNTTDGWRDANGDAASWGTAGGVCVKIKDPASGIIDYIGCFDDTHVAGEVYTAKWGFVNPDTDKAVVIDVVINFVSTVGINGVNAADLENADIYTIGGVKMQKGAKLQKGIYIVNGKKMSVK